MPDLGDAEVGRAIDAAYEAQKDWAAQDRQGARRGAAQLVRPDGRATPTTSRAILTAEKGKPLAEAKGEILYGASFIEWFAEEAKRVYGETIPGHQPDKRIARHPAADRRRRLDHALELPERDDRAQGRRRRWPPAAPSSPSPPARRRSRRWRMAVLAERAGRAEGPVSASSPRSRAPKIGKDFCAHPKVRKLTFTGSTEVGRILLRQAAEQVLKCSMELGGNAPFIVFDDADLDAAVEGAMISKYRNNGQTCVCANRIYVQAGVYDAFADEARRAGRRR